MLKTKQIKNDDAPYELIYLADEDDDQIKKYIDSSTFLATMDDEKIIGIIGINEINEESTEIVCVAVDEEYQNKKIGTNLIEKAISVSKEKKYKEILIKTGNCGIGQLYLYQRCGFRFDSINKNYMIENYKNPIYENDIQCFDQIVLKYTIYSKEALVLLDLTSKGPLQRALWRLSPPKATLLFELVKCIVLIYSPPCSPRS